MRPLVGKHIPAQVSHSCVSYTLSFSLVIPHSTHRIVALCARESIGHWSYVCVYVRVCVCVYSMDTCSQLQAPPSSAMPSYLFAGMRTH